MKKEFIYFKTGRTEVKKLNVDDILYLQADGSYTNIFCKEDLSITLSKNMKTTLKEANCSNILKINRGIAVNYMKIKTFKSGKNPIVILENNAELKPSRAYLESLKTICVYKIKV